MEATAEQQVKVVNPFDFSGSKPEQKAVTHTEDATPKASDDPALPAEDAAPAAKAPKEVSADLTDEDRNLLGLDADPEPAVEWNDDAKGLFKKFFGADDPSAFKDEVSRIREEHNLLSEEAKELRALKQERERLSPHMLRAMELEMQKVGEGQKYLRELPDTDMLQLEPKKIGDKQLLDTFVKDHGITAEEWEILKDPDADPNEVSALKRRIGHLRSIGEDMLKKTQTSLQEEVQRTAAEQQQAYEKYKQAVATSIAKAKEGPLKSYVTPDHIKDIQEGRLSSRLFESDGFTPKPETLEMILKAELYDKMREAAKKVAFKKGKEEGLAEQTSAMPDRPRGTRAASTPSNNKVDAWAKTLDNIEASIR